MGDLPLDQGAGDDADDLAAGVERGVGDRAHQPELGAAIDQARARAPRSRRPRSRAASA